MHTSSFGHRLSQLGAMGVALMFILCQCTLSARADEEPSPRRSEQADRAARLLLPMPGDASMKFQRVYLGIGDEPFALREFIAGDASGGDFAETPTKVAFSGSHVEHNPVLGRADWVYYIGETEVTVAQYCAVMNSVKTDAPDLPKTGCSWHEAQEFLRRYNLWLLEHAVDRLPLSGRYPAQLRLPTEPEWEFAARGGTEVPARLFEARYPYPPGTLADYECFFEGRTIGKPSPVKSRKPNPLGLYDMLGNVSEMTATAYSVEFFQGRTGGFVVKGGNISTEARHIRASARSEGNYFDPDDRRESRSPFVGFRLVLGCPIYVSLATHGQLAKAWDGYRSGRQVPTLAELSTKPVLDQANYDFADIARALTRLRGLLSGLHGVPPEAGEQIAFIGDWYSNVNSRVVRQQLSIARVLYKQAMYLVESLIGRGFKTNESLRVEQEVVAELMANVYGQLLTFQTNVLIEAFQNYEKELLDASDEACVRTNRYRLERLKSSLPDNLASILSRKTPEADKPRSQ